MSQSNENYLVREAKEDEVKNVLALLKGNYLYKETFHQSYISKHINEYSSEEKERVESDVVRSLEHLLTDAPSLVVVHRESKKIVGSLLLEHVNSIEEKKSISTKNTISSQLSSDILSYLEIIYKNANISEKFSRAKKILQFRFFCVDELHRHKNLSTMLLEEGVKWSKKNEYDIAYGLFTSAFSKKAAANAGLKSIFDCDIRDFRDSKGLSAFADATPHNVISIMAVDLN